ncbi:MAG: F0F1 ATP synthase subunit alpha [Candidatus Wildermuthbacteria bacterium RIFCSPLOWO2_02_FULL_47_9c]|uniref:ATP synthase subunit alpha n=2 Tax=Parcubacteria group TaxID=1794811 RepID=A0A837IKY4_9BACT|nr:MAG: ATP synthase subunit alpha [Candidatus Yanofskybacteria bacterium GW2011_GWC1_48_11]KKW04514.1 MAG: ATP synthase subunit alpha [Parcubacteria group bacterium GW2011_GWB1_49_12]KKW09228.1 MAG: ATP synthase subunit alpha [Parcubacteria group bacterium GW2011_GWA1_49_26]OHA61479.1 MAG: F0F1 ATP synthase subunit alpha [Candidatus Wildermuthbacteria bacterium GWA1_49_26]OHA66178.1 MAG: F0F1 ATP synthase subunit alpha [Candidatus Wildermuthbacteria bacterium RIFCSPHIGHO2_01_FULL_50_47]OHA697
MAKDFLFDILQKELQGIEAGPKGEEIGRVVSVGDGVAQIEGLPNAMFSEMVEIGEKSVPAIVLNLEEYIVGAVVLGEDKVIREGDVVKRTKRVLSVPVGESLLGRVVNPLGVPLDGKGGLGEKVEMLPIERPVPSVIEREPVNTPLATGIKVIDATIPIGRGQRELVIGDRQIGKTAFVQDTILNQLHEPEENRPICIYVAIGQKASKVAQFVKELDERGAMDYTIVVLASASEPAPLWYIAPYAGCSMGEYFRDKGKDALIIYDDLSKHAWAWRQLALLLRRPPGREAYPGDVFYLHSRLLERAAKLSKEKGGGSLTALPLIETQLGDVSAYIPTNVISITDGQIYLESDLFSKGQRPAVNIGLSVSRVGSAAQTKAMKKVAAQLKLDLAQFQELAAFAQFAQDLDKATKAKIDRGQRLMEILKQGQFEPMPMEEQVCALFAGIEGYLDAVPLGQIRDFEKKLLHYLQDHHAAILKTIRETKDFDDKTKESLKKALESFKF